MQHLGSKEETLYLKSEAVLRILDEIGGFWRPVSWLRIVPRSIRDTGYDWIARNRYRWFGRYDECIVPDPEARARFRP